MYVAWVPPARTAASTATAGVLAVPIATIASPLPTPVSASV